MKPILYHDIDGVLFGEYGPRQTHQLRPGVHDWFHWVLKRYQLVFVTSWQQDQLFDLLKSLYLHDVIDACRYLPWQSAGLAFKWDAIQHDQRMTPHPFLWIDDDPSVFPDGPIRSQYFAALPFVRVNPTGANQLADLMQRLNARTEKLKIQLEPHPPASRPVLSPIF